MLQTINCQLIFGLIYCGWLAKCTVYCIYVYLLVFQFSPFLLDIPSMSSGKKKKGNLATDEKICLDSGCCPLPSLIKQIIKIEFRFVCLSLFLILFLPFFMPLALKWRCLLSFQLWRKTWQIKMRIHSSHVPSFLLPEHM